MSDSLCVFLAEKPFEFLAEKPFEFLAGKTV